MGLVLKGTLNMPLPDDPADMDLVTWAQVKMAMRDASREIDLLQTAIVKYGDHSRMGTVEPMELQQAIDRAFEQRP
jgi:hypothetical protein